MKKILMICCLNLILLSCTKPVDEGKTTREVEQNLSSAELNQIWKPLNQKVYRCEKQCPRQDLTVVNFSQVDHYYMILVDGKTGFIEEFYKINDGIKMNINWDDGSGGFKNEDLVFNFEDEQHFKIKDKNNNINSYQFVSAYDE